MKRITITSLLLLGMLSTISAQIKPIDPIPQKKVILEFQMDFHRFIKKTDTMPMNEKNKIRLADKYSDLIDRMDGIFHTPKVPNQNKAVQLSQASTSNHKDW